MYNLTNATNSEHYLDFMLAVNNFSDGYYFVVGLFAMFIILFISMKNYDTGTAFLASSTITLILTILLVFVQVIAWWQTIFFLILVIVGMFIKIWGDGG